MASGRPGDVVGSDGDGIRVVNGEMYGLTEVMK